MDHVMTADEIHDFGIEVVCSQLKNDGNEIKSVNTKLGTDPQIIATVNDHLAFIAVRTACYPNKGILEENIHFKMIDHADEQNAIPYFASVGIANAEAQTDQEMSIPKRGSGFHVSYEGLLIISRSDRVKTIE